jgi:hypothetical protein
MRDEYRLSDYALELLKSKPVHSDRKSGAAIIRRHYFEISPRTLERWPLTWQLINGKSNCTTRELLAVAEAMIASAPVVRSGRHVVEGTTDSVGPRRHGGHRTGTRRTGPVQRQGTT